ncbi:Flp pilus assembly complex ATPase component TadA [Desulfurococcaceae archaeon MEX13E-LK6-19]|nr:Flp pilus assembly complex ATPase component TadA [Desulfurococcaceae archaeon MEX13E-LK6-19]
MIKFRLFRKRKPKIVRESKILRMSLDKMPHVVKNGTLLERYNIGLAAVYIYEYEGLGYYIVDEPELNEQEKRLYNIIMNSLYYAMKPLEKEEPVKYVEEQMISIAKDLGIYEQVLESFDKLKYYIIRDTLGYGPLDVPLKDPRIEDISLEGVGRPVRVFHRDYSYLDWLISNIIFDDESVLDNTILMIAHKAKKHVSTAFPIAEGSLPEKHRVAITYSREITPFGSSITIRKFREEPFTICHLIKFGTVSSLMAAYWWLLLENKGSVFIVGEMASGKSVHGHSVLAAILSNKPLLVTIEELWDLLSRHKPVVKQGDMEYIDLSDVDLRILALDKGFNVSWKKPKYIIRHRAPRRLVKIVTESGRQIIVTEDHSLITTDGRNLYVKKPLELNSGDKLVVINRLELPKTTVDIKQDEILKNILGDESSRVLPEGNRDIIAKPELGYILGYILVQANDKTSNLRIRVDKNDDLVHEKIKNCLDSLGLKYEAVDRGVSREYMLLDSSVAYLLKRIVNLKEELFRYLFLFNREWLAKFLEGIRDATKSSEIVFDSEETAYKFLHVLQYVGLGNSVSIENVDGKYVVKLDSVTGSSSNGPVVFENIREITMVEQSGGYVYDLEVPGNETFEANTIIVHNTTLLNTLATLLPPTWKIVSVEDTPELRLPHIGWKPLVARHVYTLAESKTEIGLFDLVKLALRERAQFIIVGEIRGEEAYVFVQALATGHGGACTFHGDSIKSMVMRLVTPPINVPISFLPLISNVIITRFIRIPGRKPMRRVIEVDEITGVKGATDVDYIKVFYWDPEKDKHYPDDEEEVVKKSVKLESMARLLGWTKDMVYEELVLRRKFLESLVENNILRYEDVVKHIQRFYSERRRIRE